MDQPRPDKAGKAEGNPEFPPHTAGKVQSPERTVNLMGALFPLFA